MPPNVFAVIAGVGSGTGAALARRFAKAYPVVLLARREESFKSLVQELNDAGHRAVGVTADVSVRSSVVAAFERIGDAMGSDALCAVSTNCHTLMGFTDS